MSAFERTAHVMTLGGWPGDERSPGKYIRRSGQESVCKGTVRSASAAEASEKVRGERKPSMKTWPTERELLGELVGSISLVKEGQGGFCEMDRDEL